MYFKHIKIYFWFIVLPGFIWPGTSAQEHLWKTERLEGWSLLNRNTRESEKNAFRLTCDGCKFPDQNSDIPVYHKILPLDNTSPDHYIIVPTHVSTLDPAIVEATHLEADIPDSFTYDARVVSLRKKKHLEVELIPVFRATDGTIKRVNEYEIRHTGGTLPESGLNKSHPAFQNSVLATGSWLKMKITESGIYRITYEELAALGLSDPATPRIFGNGGRMVPEMNNIPREDGLQECAIWFEKGSDNVFNAGDYLLFYAEGPVVWHYDATRQMFLHQLHLYDEASYYYITSGQGTGPLINALATPGTPVAREVQYYDYRTYREVETENLIRSGREWFEPLSPFNVNQYGFSGSRFQLAEPARLFITTVARSSQPTYFEISSNGQNIADIVISEVNLGSYSSYYAKKGVDLVEFNLTVDQLNITIDINNAMASESKFWLDFIDLNVRRELYLEGTQMDFRDVASMGSGNVSRFHLKNADDLTQVWDITDIQHPGKLETALAGSELTFICETDSLREFIAFGNGPFLEPEFLEEEIENQDLLSVYDIDMIIVSPEEFMVEAERLADYRRTHDQLEVVLVTPETVYHDFSSGKRDPGAIRDFVKRVYDHSDQDALIKYLLLFGDGSFNNRSDHENNSNQIPTYQSENSIHYTLSYVTDDFYGLLDDDEGGSTGLVDIGIGRLPVNTLEEASNVVDKIISYDGPQSYGPWRNRIRFVADDGDISDGYTSVHMTQADQLSDAIQSDHPSFNNHKIFLDAYQKVSSPSGATYPEVNKTLNDAINTGSLIINYTGHGNERGLAHEKILGISDIQSWSNKHQLPLFITATCEFSRFDDIDQDINGEINLKTSAGELVLLRPDGGGIGLLTTTRLVYSYPNFILNQNFYENVFERDTNGLRLRLGDILRKTKNESGPGINKRNFTLLGDPSLVLAYPDHFVQTDSINHIPVAEFTDTLKGLQKYTISGRITSRAGDPMNTYNGEVYPIVFDKEYTMKTLSNNDTPVLEFQVRDKILYNGKASVLNGHFEFSFIVPKDVSFKSGQGKISYFFKNAAGDQDAQGYYNAFDIGGFGDQIETDLDGPVIELYLNDEKFSDGGLTDPNPVLYARVFDQSGINTLGTGIGHDIVAILDEDYNNPFILNEFYESDLDSYQSGTITYPLSGLAEGSHTICLKVWDIYNNSSEECIRFEVTTSSAPVVRNLINYPNPFNSGTSIVMEHNMADSEFDVTISIYNLSGQIIKTITDRYYSAGYKLGPILWDGTNSHGSPVQGGLYLYRLRLQAEDGSFAEITSKMLKVR